VSLKEASGEGLTFWRAELSDEKGRGREADS